MFDIAWSELLLIAVVALIFIGPKELPHVLHSLGRMVTKIRRQADEFRRQFEDSVREAGYEDLHKNIQEFRSLNPTNQLKDHIVRAINQDPAPKVAETAEPAPVDPALAEASTSKDAALEPPAAKPLQEAPADAVAASAPPLPEKAAASKPAADAPVEARPTAAAVHEFAQDRIAPAA
jgi:sec-independent protein translocase protein TatB